MSDAASSNYSTGVCYIVATFSDGSSEQASGAIIGAHTVLTASHLLWNATTGQAATSVTVYAGYNAGGEAITGDYVQHFNQVNDAGGLLSKSTSANDFAIIDYSADLSRYGSFGVSTNFAGGAVHLTGYPASLYGSQVDQTGAVAADARYATLNYQSLSSLPGDSGGPVWIDAGTPADPQPCVVGVVSTTGWAVRLTDADLATIQAWRHADSYLWATSGSELTASNSPTPVTGGAGDDTLTGGAGANTLFGGAGNDLITTGAGANRVNGNSGEDTIVGHSTVGDWLLGGQGDDSIDASASTGANIIGGNLGDDTLIGGSGPDTIRGGQGNDVIHAGSGADWISGDLGVNTIYGGQGMDTFHAGAGHDVINGWHTGDRVQVDAGVSFSATQVNADVHVAFSNGGEMDLLNTQASSLQSGWIFSA
jgi:Ca2+-binding RTX toxin-like protein